MNIEQYIKKTFEDDPSLSAYDISPGSNLYDMLVVPMRRILEDGISGIISSSAAMYNPDNYDNLDTTTLIDIAKQYGIPIDRQSAAYGYATFVFRAPVTVVIPRYTTLTNGTVTYSIVDDETIFASFLSANQRNDGLYTSQPILIHNPDGQGVEANMLGLTSSYVEDLVGVEHDSINNGVVSISSDKIASIIRGAARGIYTGTSSSLSALIHSMAPNINDIVIVGAGDPRMTRDLLVNAYVYGTPADNEQSFIGKVYGDDETNPNVAYYWISSSSLPRIDAMYNKQELSQYQYIKLGRRERSSVKIETDNIFMDTFASYAGLTYQTTVDVGIAAGEDFMCVSDDTFISPGNHVYVEGTSDTKPVKTCVIIKDIESAEYSATDVSGNNNQLNVVGVSARNYETLDKAGRKITLTYTTTSTGVVTKATDTLSMIGEYDPGSDVTITLSTIDIPSSGISNIRVSWDTPTIMGEFPYAITGAKVSAMDDISTQLGNGWFKSEHGYPVGYVISPNEIYVKNEMAVLGGDTGYIPNPMKDVIYQNGVGRFISAIMGAITVKYGQNTTAHAVQTQHSEIISDR